MNNSRFSLLYLISHNLWDSVVERLETERGKKEASKKDRSIHSFNNRYPIFLACFEKDVPLKVITALLVAYPDGVKEQDDDGYLPIHFAAGRSRSVDVVKRLINAYPNGVKQKTEYGDLPIHEALRNPDISLGVVRQLVEAYPKGLQQQNDYGRLPIHYAVLRRSPSLDIIKILLESSPISAVISCPYEVAVEDKGKGGVTKEVAVLDEHDRYIGTPKTITKHLMPSVLLCYVGKFRYSARLESVADVILYLVESKEKEHIVKLARAAVEHNEIEKKHGSTTKRKADVLNSTSTSE